MAVPILPCIEKMRHTPSSTCIRESLKQFIKEASEDDMRLTWAVCWMGGKGEKFGAIMGKGFSRFHALESSRAVMQECAHTSCCAGGLVARFSLLAVAAMMKIIAAI